MKKTSVLPDLLTTTTRLANRPGLLAVLFCIGSVEVANADYDDQIVRLDSPDDDRLHVDVLAHRSLTQADIDSINRAGMDILSMGTDAFDDSEWLRVCLVERVTPPSDAAR